MNIDNLKYENYIFDLDGTIVDSRQDLENCLGLAYQKHGLDFNNELLVIGPTIDKIIKILTPDCSDDVMKSLIQAFRIEYLLSNSKHTQLYDGVLDFIVNLKSKNCQVFLATNKPIVPTKKIIEKFSLSFFSEVSTPDFLENKVLSKTQMIDYIISKYNLEPSKTLMIGDTEGDIVAGKNNKISTCAYLGGYGAMLDIQNASPDIIFSSYDELLQQIKK